MKENKKTPKGFIYNLILFSKYWWGYFKFREQYLLSMNSILKMWVDGMSNHISELEIPKQFKDTEIGITAKKLKELTEDIKNNKTPTEMNFKQIFNCIESLAILIDKELFNNKLN